jgi:hypothetical protein
MFHDSPPLLAALNNEREARSRSLVFVSVYTPLVVIRALSSSPVIFFLAIAVVRWRKRRWK